MSLLKSIALAASGALLFATMTVNSSLAAYKFSAVYVMSDNLGDMGFNDNAATGFKKAEADGVKIRMLQASPTDPQLWRQNLEAVSGGGKWDLIFAGPHMHDILADVSSQHPDKKYVMFDDELKAPNVLSIKYAQNEGSYLAGALAASAATDKKNFPLTSGDAKIAVVAGMDMPIIQDFILGFKQGATTVNPNINIQVIFIGNFNDAQKAYDLTKAAIDNGANVVYNVAGPAGLGILKAAADANKYAIGVDSDQNNLHPKNILASMIKNIGVSIYDTIGQAKGGNAKYGTLQIYGLANKGVGLVYNDALVPADVKKQVDEAKAKVLNGQIKVDTAFK